MGIHLSLLENVRCPCLPSVLVKDLRGEFSDKVLGICVFPTIKQECLYEPHEKVWVSV